MTADFFPFDMGILGRAATRIINEVNGINRVVYDVMSKPPGVNRPGVCRFAGATLGRHGTRICTVLPA